MSKIKELQDAMISAMKAKDKFRKDSISLLVAAAKKDAIDKGLRDDIPEDMVNMAIARETKMAKEQVDSCPADRDDLKAEYEARYNIFKEFMPEMMSAEAIESFIKEKFADILATGNKGQLMKSVMPELKGKADGKLINEVVAKLVG